jgi:hypothetical protein
LINPGVTTRLPPAFGRLVLPTVRIRVQGPPSPVTGAAVQLNLHDFVTFKGSPGKSGRLNAVLVLIKQFEASVSAGLTRPLGATVH